MVPRRYHVVKGLAAESCDKPLPPRPLSCLVCRVWLDTGRQRQQHGVPLPELAVQVAVLPLQLLHPQRQVGGQPVRWCRCFVRSRALSAVLSLAPYLTGRLTGWCLVTPGHPDAPLAPFLAPQQAAVLPASLDALCRQPEPT